MKKIKFPFVMNEKREKVSKSMALIAIEELFLEIFKDYAILLRNYSKSLKEEDLQDPSNLSHGALDILRAEIDAHKPVDPAMIDSSMKMVFFEAIPAYWVYYFVFQAYEDCFRYGFAKMLEGVARRREEEKNGQDSAKRLLRLPSFKKIIEIAESNVDEDPRMLKLKEVISDYHYGQMKKVIFTSNALAPYVKKFLDKNNFRTEIIKSGKGTKKIQLLKNGELESLILTVIPKGGMEISRLMIIHHILPDSKDARRKKNKCNGETAPEFIYYIYLDHFMDQWRKKVTEDKFKSVKGMESIPFPEEDD